MHLPMFANAARSKHPAPFRHRPYSRQDTCKHCLRPSIPTSLSQCPIAINSRQNRHQAEVSINCQDLAASASCLSIGKSRYETPTSTTSSLTTLASDNDNMCCFFSPGVSKVTGRRELCSLPNSPSPSDKMPINPRGWRLFVKMLLAVKSCVAELSFALAMQHLLVWFL